MAEEGMKLGNINEIAAAIGKSVADNVSAASANEAVLGVEREREAVKERQEFKDILYGIHKSIDSSFSSAKDTNTKTGGLLAGLFGGMGSAGLGGLGKAVASIGKGFGIGLAALGAGIAGFLLAIGGVMVIFDLIGPDGSALKHVVHTFFGAFDAKAATLMGGIIAIAAVMAKFNVPKKQFMKAMTAIGAGIGGFFAGILLGDLAASIGDAVGLNGENLALLMKNFFGAFDGIGVAFITSMALLATTIATVPGGSPRKLMKGMFALGAGLGGFFGGVLLGDMVAIGADAIGVDGTTLAKLMSNFFGAFDGLAGTATLLTLLGAGAIVGLAPSKGIAKKIMTGMFAIGAGLGGFFGGVILADIVANLAIGAGMDGGNLAKMMQNFLASFADVDSTALLVLGGLLAAGAAIGALKGIASATSVALGMTAIGVGLAGFFGGILLADAIAGWGDQEGLDGSKLSKLMKTFMGTFDGVSDKGLIVLGAILAAGATMGALLSPAKLLKVPLGMTALGAGLAGFFGGLSLAETLMTKVADWTGTKVSDGATLSTFIQNFAKALDSMTDKSLMILGGLLVAGAAIGVALPGVGPAGVALGMTALGAGLAGFFAGLSMADFVASKAGTGESLALLMTNLGKGIGGFVGGMGKGIVEQLDAINPDRLSKLGEGMKNVGVGMMALTGGSAVGAVAGAVEGAVGFFKGLFGSDKEEGPFDKIIALSTNKDVNPDRLSKIGKGIHDLGIGMAAMGGINNKNLIGNIDAISKFGVIGGEMTPTQLDNMAKTMNMLIGSQNMEQQRGGAQIVVNNIDQSQQTQTNMNRTQNLNVGSDSPNNQNSTLAKVGD